MTPIVTPERQFASDFIVPGYAVAVVPRLIRLGRLVQIEDKFPCP